MGTVVLHVLKRAHHGSDNLRFKTLRTGLACTTMLYSARATQYAGALVKEFLAQHLR